MAPTPAVRSAGWTGWIGLGLHAALWRRMRHLADESWWMRNSGAVQIAQLRALLSRARATRFGRAHGFARLARLPAAELSAAYRGAVPIGDWLAFREPVARMRCEGETDLLWPGRIDDFAQTSGTTGGEKYLPVSRELLRSNLHAARDLFAYVARFGVPLGRLFAGRLLFLGGSTSLETNALGIRTGDLSGIVSRRVRWPMTLVALPPRDIALMGDWSRKLEAMARVSARHDVRLIAGVPTWVLALCDRVMEQTGARCIRELWPNLMLYIHGGVRYDPFEPRVRRAYCGRTDGDDIPARLEVYAASEAFVAIQDRPGDRGLRVIVDGGVYYEFVPASQAGRPDAEAFGVAEVERGERYAVVVSTCAGLWRYAVGDVVEFDTIPARADGRGGEGPARLRIVGRTSHFINAFGEHVIVEQIETAVAEASRQTGLVVGEFTAGPVYPEPGQPGALELAIELEQAGPEAVERFGRAFDEALCRQNLDYTAKRAGNAGMGPPRITVLPRGSFERYLAQAGRAGGQHKCPRCANDRELLDRVTAAARGAVGAAG